MGETGVKWVRQVLSGLDMCSVSEIGIKWVRQVFSE